MAATTTPTQEISAPRTGARVYDAFLSYSHAADGHLAPALQAGLQSLAKPWHRRRALRVFRDKTSLSASPELWPAIEGALSQARYFVLLASPEAAASHWVEEEVRWWRAHRSHDAVLIALTDGVLRWDDGHRDFDAAAAVPPGLRGWFPLEPLWVDLRWARDERDVSMRNPRFRDSVGELAAPLHGLPKDELIGEDINQHRRTLRLARGGVALLVLLLAVAVVGGVVALIQRNNALDQKRLAFARELAVASGAQRPQDPELALLLGIEAVRTQDNEQTADALRGALSDVHLRTILRVGTRPVRSIAYRADGQAILTASDDGHVRLWRPGARTPMLRLVAGPPGETHAAFAGRGRLVLTTNERSATRLWDTATRRVVRTLPDRKYHETGGAVSPDATHILTVTWDQTARIWTKGRPDPHVMRAPEQEWIDGAAISPDGRLVATVGGRVRLWSITRPTESRALRASGPSSFGSVGFSADGRRLIAVGDDGEIEELDVRGGPAETLMGESGGTFYPIRTLAARSSPNNELLAAGRSDGTLVLKDFSGEARDFTTQTAGGMVHDVGFAPDGQTIVTAQEDGTARIFSVTLVDRLSAVLRGSTTAFNDVAFSPNGRYVAGADTFGVVHVWTPAGRPVSRVRLSRNRADNQVTFSPNGKLLAVAGRAGTAIWPVSASRPILRLRDPSSDAAFSNDGRLLAVGRRSGVVEVRRLRTGRVAQTLGNSRGKPLSSVAFSPDDSRLLTVVEFGPTRIWTRDNKPAPLVLGGRDASSADAAFSPDGDSVALARVDGKVRIAKLTAPSESRTVTVGTEPLSSVTWSADGRLLLVASQDGKATVLDASRLQPITTFVGSGESLSGASFNPSATLVALAGDGTTVQIHRCHLCGSTERLLATARSIAARRLTRAERERYLHESAP